MFERDTLREIAAISIAVRDDLITIVKEEGVPKIQIEESYRFVNHYGQVRGINIYNRLYASRVVWEAPWPKLKELFEVAKRTSMRGVV